MEYRFSEEFEKALLAMFGEFSEKVAQLPPKHLDLYTQEEAREILGISYATLLRWEQAGLKRYQPPLEDTKKAYYLGKEVLAFLGVDIFKGYKD